MIRPVAALALLLALSAGVKAQSAEVCPTYVVSSGDTLSGIAERYGTTVSDLEAAMTSCIIGYEAGKTVIQPNQLICLPPWYDACRYVNSAGSIPQCKYYKIQSGDTLETIASNLGLMRLDLEALNPDADMLVVGQYVKLTGWQDDCPPPGNAQACGFYVAASGDSLASIATAFSVDLTELTELNTNITADGSTTSTILQPGQRVFIPPFPSICGDGVEVKKPTDNCRQYEVQPGDDLYRIAYYFQTTVDQLLAVNPSLAGSTTLSTYTKVIIPPYDPNECVVGMTDVQPEYLPISPAPASPDYETQSSDVAPAPSPAPAAFLDTLVDGAPDKKEKPCEEEEKEGKKESRRLLRRA